MEQPHTEGDYAHTDNQQDTGNHRVGDAKPKTPGGTRIGAENVEQPVASSGKGPEVDTGLESDLDDSVSVNGPAERQTE